MQSRMRNPVLVLPKALEAVRAIAAPGDAAGVPEALAHLIEIRASQINGCSLCVDLHSYQLRALGESDERLFAIAAWRDAPYYTAAERAALALTEAVTRLSDREDPVPDAVWHEVEAQFDESARAALLLVIARINVWNRLNVATRQPADAWRELMRPRAAQRTSQAAAPR